jgi:hypothetical protein
MIYYIDSSQLMLNHQIHDLACEFQWFNNIFKILII